MNHEIFALTITYVIGESAKKSPINKELTPNSVILNASTGSKYHDWKYEKNAAIAVKTKTFLENNSLYLIVLGPGSKENERTSDIEFSIPLRLLISWSSTDFGITNLSKGAREIKVTPIQKNVALKPSVEYNIEPATGPTNNPTPIDASKNPKYLCCSSGKVMATIA